MGRHELLVISDHILECAEQERIDSANKEASVGLQYGLQYGWACPKCGAVYAPSVTECSRCSPDKVSYDWTFGFEV